MSNGASIDPLLLRQLTQLVDQSAAEVAGGHGLTVDQWRMLGRLADTAADTMAGLAAALALTAPTATRVADRLVTMTLVYRDADATDRRKVVLRLSRRGHRLHDQLATEIAAQQEKALSNLNSDEQALLADLLNRATDGEVPLLRGGVDPTGQRNTGRIAV